MVIAPEKIILFFYYSYKVNFTMRITILASQGTPKHLVALDDISIQLEKNSTMILGQDEPEADIEDEVRPTQLSAAYTC